MKRLLPILILSMCPPLTLPAEETPFSLRVALTSFTSDDHSYQSLQVGNEFSQALGNLLYATTGFEWVERQQLDTAFQEIQMGAYGLVDPAQAVRAGHWAGADLLLTGHFVSDDQSRRLRLQAIDLQRADILGEAMVPMTGTRRSAVLFRQSEVMETLQAASSLLEAAAEALEHRALQKTVAPLFFRNTDPARRMDYLGERFLKTLGARIEGDANVHLLKFPQAETARAEAELAISGLADVDHTAWQKVADLYVWGEYTEAEAEGRPLEEVIVEATLFIWDGSGDLKQIVRRFPVKAGDPFLEEFVNEVIAATAEEHTRPPSEAARTSVAHRLLARESELKKSLEVQEKEISGFGASPAAAALRGYRLVLLDTICFFDPDNRDARWERLLLQARPLNQRTPLLVHIGVTEGFVQWLDQYGLDESNPATLEQARRAFGRMASLIRHFYGREYDYTVPSDVPGSVRNSWTREWSRRYAERVLRWRDLAPMDRQHRIRFQHDLQDWLEVALKHFFDDELTARFVEALWPTYRQLFLDGPGFAGPFEKELFSEVRRFYVGHGQREKAEELLADLEELTPETRMKRFREEAEARRARQLATPPAPPSEQAKPPPPAPAPVARSRPPNRSFMERATEWFGPSGEKQEEQRLEEVRARMNPFASARELEPHARRVFLPLSGEFAASNLAWRVEDLKSDQGRLWVRGQVLPYSAPAIDSGAVHVDLYTAPPAASVVWTCDPISAAAQMVWERRTNRGVAFDFSPNGADVWLALDSAGLVHRTPDGEKAFGLEEGLLTLNLFALSQRGGKLYFGGGLGGDPLLGYLDLSSLQVFRLQLPAAGEEPEELQANATASRRVRQIVSGGKWLAVQTDAIQFLNTETGAWLDHRHPAGQEQRTQHRSSRPERKSTAPLVYDGSSFWIGDRRGLWRFAPGRDAAATRLVSRVPSGIDFDGEFIWVAFSSPNEARSDVPAALQSSRAPTGSSVVAAWSLAANEWVLRFKLDRPVTGLAADPWTLWLAVDHSSAPLLEVDRTSLIRELGKSVGKRSAALPAGDSRDPVAALQRAVFEGAVDEVLQLIGQDALGENNAAGQASALTIAVRRGHFELARLLLSAGADPNAEGPAGDTALLVATEMERPEMVGLLLAAGADPDCFRPADQLSPLLAALQCGNPGLAGMLLGWGADPEGPRLPDPTPGGLATRFESPLILAVERKDINSARALLLKGANADRRVAGKTALSLAVAGGDVDLVKLLLDHGANPDLPGIGGRTPLYLATGRKDDGLFDLLLEHGADPAAATLSGATPLGAAISRNTPDRAASLIRQLGNPAQRLGEVQRGTDALARAVAQDDLETARMLLDAGVNPNLSSQFDRKPLLLVACERAASPAMLRLLLAYGADLHPEERGHRVALSTGTMPREARAVLQEAHEFMAGAESPLDLLRRFAPWRNMTAELLRLIEAAHSGNLEQVRVLLDAGIDLNTRDHRGWTPLIYAIQGPHSEVTNLLLDRGATVNVPTAFGSTPLAFATGQEDESLVERLLAAGADPNLAFYRSAYPIHSAASREPGRLLELLIRHEADVHRRRPDGQTALHLAVEGQAMHCVEILLNEGADPEAKGKKDQRPIEFAAAGESVAILKRLVDAGASVHPPNPRGPTPLEHALLYGRTENIALLRAAGARERPKSTLDQMPVHYEGDGPLPHVRDFDSLRAVMEEQDLDVNAVQGATLLQQVLPFHFDDVRPALYVIERGADVNRIGTARYRTPPIVMAVENARPKRVQGNLPDADLIRLLQAMIERGADINARDPTMLRTVLMHAVEGGREEVVEFLLKAGAKADLTDIQNRSAVELLPPAHNRLHDPAALQRIRALLGS